MALMQFEDKAAPYQGLYCPLPESVDTIVYVDKQRMLRLDCTGAHAIPSLLACDIKALFPKCGSYQIGLPQLYVKM